MLLALLSPPGINLILISVGLILLRKFRRAAITLLAVALGSLFLLSLPIISHSLSQSIEPDKIISLSKIKQYLASKDKDTAIVVLSAGRQPKANEYGNVDTVNAETLQRINYASWLQKKLQLPILLSGGSRFNEPTSEAVLMNLVMLSSFSVAPRWIESESKNIAESAEFSSEILNNDNISEVILITHSNQISRASYAFHKHGIDIIQAPIMLSTLKSSQSELSYLPSAKALVKSSDALQESIQLWWYRIRY